MHSSVILPFVPDKCSLKQRVHIRGCGGLPIREPGPVALRTGVVAARFCGRSLTISRQFNLNSPGARSLSPCILGRRPLLLRRLVLQIERAIGVLIWVRRASRGLPVREKRLLEKRPLVRVKGRPTRTPKITCEGKEDATLRRGASKNCKSSKHSELPQEVRV